MRDKICYLDGIAYRDVPNSEIDKLPDKMLVLRYQNHDFLVSPPTWDGKGGDVFMELADSDNCPVLVRVAGEYREKILGKKDSYTGGNN